MGFWEMAGKVARGAAEVGKAICNDAKQYGENYHESYSNYSDKYSKMSKSQLRDEYNSLKSNPGSGARAAGRISAMKGELESRGYVKKKEN